MTPDLTVPAWTRSTRCSGGTCVEVAEAGTAVLLRDSKRPDLAPLSFDKEEWSAFTASIRSGGFDTL